MHQYHFLPGEQPQMGFGLEFFKNMFPSWTYCLIMLYSVFSGLWKCPTSTSTSSSTNGWCPSSTTSRPSPPCSTSFGRQEIPQICFPAATPAIQLPSTSTCNGQPPSSTATSTHWRRPRGPARLPSTSSSYYWLWFTATSSTVYEQPTTTASPS